MRPVLLSISLGATLALSGCGDETTIFEEADTGVEPSDGIVTDDTSAPVDSGEVDSSVVFDSGDDDTATDDARDAVSSDGSTDGGGDTTVVDGSPTDTFVADTFVPDTRVADTFVADTAVADTYVTDTASDAGSLACEAPAPLSGGLAYGTISAVNFYVSGAGPTVRGCWTEYKPAYELWSDGLVKRRWIFLPSGTTIATGPNPVGGAFPNMDQWQFPVGTRFMKEFARSDGKKLETRIWERTSTGYRFGSFKWRADQTDADYTETGGTAALTLDDGTTAWDIPKKADCSKCHDGELGKGLGFSAVQLSKAAAFTGDVTLSSIVAKGWLSHPPSTMPSTVGSPVPGNTTEASALGRLHASCGHCHNPNGNANAVDLNLRVGWGDATVASTKAWTTAVGVSTKAWSKFGISLRIDPGTSAVGDGVPGKSAVYYRSSVRGSNDEMPPLGSVKVDTVGLAALEAWIKSL